VSCRILIVDDERAIRDLLALSFRTAGYEVKTAANAVEAMALCETEAFEALLSDVMMPGMDGHELAQWMAARFPCTRTVLMTGFDDGCPGCPYAPRCHFLHKPFRPTEAVQMMGEMLQKIK